MPLGPPPELWLRGHLPLAICSLVSRFLRVAGLWAASCRSWASVWLVFGWLAAESQVSGSQVVLPASACTCMFPAAASLFPSPVLKRPPPFASGLPAFWTLASWPPPELWLRGHLPLAICSLVSCLLRVVGLWAASCRSWVSMWLVFGWLAAESQVSGSQAVLAASMRS